MAAPSANILLFISVIFSESCDPPVPQAGSAIILPGSGHIHATIARISARDGEVLSRTVFRVLCVALQQPLVDVALYVGSEHHPIRAVHHVDQAEKLGRIGDLALRLGENLAQHASLVAKSPE